MSLCHLSGKCKQKCGNRDLHPLPQFDIQWGWGLGNEVELLEWSNPSCSVIQCAIEKEMHCLDLPAGIHCSENWDSGLLLFQFRHLLEHVRDPWKLTYPGLVSIKKTWTWSRKVTDMPISCLNMNTGYWEFEALPGHSNVNKCVHFQTD